MKKTLYLSRNLLNGQELVKWAKSQGFPTAMEPDEMHCTIVYSRTPLAWPDLRSDSVWVDGPATREVVGLGDQGAVVLKFNSALLRKRWAEIRAMGASHDYPDFTPHVTFTWDGKGIDLNKVKPFAGMLHFGGEIAKEVNLNWKPKTEK